MAVGIHHTDVAEQVAFSRRCGQGDSLERLGRFLVAADGTARCSVQGDDKLRVEIDERHCQVEAGVVGAVVRREVERHALASAGDGGDGSLGATAGAAYFVKQLGAGVVAAVIDGQFVIITLRHDVARQLEQIALGGSQHKGAATVVAVVTACTAVVIDLERCDARRDGSRPRARRGHIDVGVCQVGSYGGHRVSHSQCVGIVAIISQRVAVAVGEADKGAVIGHGVVDGECHVLGGTGVECVAVYHALVVSVCGNAADIVGDCRACRRNGHAVGSADGNSLAGTGGVRAGGAAFTSNAAHAAAGMVVVGKDGFVTTVIANYCTDIFK